MTKRKPTKIQQVVLLGKQCVVSITGMEDCGYWAVECNDCGRGKPTRFVGVHADNQSDAEARWNARGALPSESGWIPVAERLPIKPFDVWCDPVLVRFDSGGHDVRGCIRYSNGGISWSLPPGVTAKVTHWMEIPK